MKYLARLAALLSLLLWGGPASADFQVSSPITFYGTDFAFSGGVLHLSAGNSGVVRRITASVTLDTMLHSDGTVQWNSPSAAAKTENLPTCSALYAGESHRVSDGQGTAGTYPILLAAPLGSTVGGQTTLQMGISYQALILQCDGVSNWITYGDTGVLAPIAGNTVLGNSTGSSAGVLAMVMPSCSGFSALTWTTNSGFGCNTEVMSGLAGDVIAGPGGGLLAATINNQAVTYAKMQNVGASKLLGNPTGSAASPSEIALGAGLSFSGSSLLIASGAITNAMLQNSTITLGGTAMSLGGSYTSLGPLNLTSPLVINAPASTQSRIDFDDAAVIKWQVGKQLDDTFFMYDAVQGVNFLTVNTGTTALGEGGAITLIRNGGAQIGTPSGGDEGVGTLNLAGSLYNNGSAPTGSGGYVRATSPTLVTPTLGVATATSITGSSILVLDTSAVGNALLMKAGGIDVIHLLSIASAVNYMILQSRESGVAPQLYASSNAGLNFGLGGTGTLIFEYNIGSTPTAMLTLNSTDKSADAVGPVRTSHGFTVAGLPGAGTAGRRAYVTDQLTSCPAIGGTFTGGGSVVCSAFDNGTSWTHE